MAEWRLRPRAGRCARCGALFAPGMAGHTLLEPEPDGEGYVRLDLCAACHAALPEAARRAASAAWPFTVGAPEPRGGRARGAAGPTAHVSAEGVLRALLERGDPRDGPAAYVLALLLERGKRVTERQLATDAAGRRIHLYEARASGDLLPVAEPPLAAEDLPAVQRRVAELLERGLRRPARVARRRRAPWPRGVVRRVRRERG